MSECLVLAGTIVAGSSGLLGFLWGRNSMIGQWATTVLAVLGAVLGLSGVTWFYASGDTQPIVLPWNLPGALFSVAVDGLSAFFLVPVFLVSLLGNLYGLHYWKQTEHPENGRKLRLFYGTLTAGMALMLISRNSIAFLFGWEILGLSTFFLIATEDQEAEARDAGWIYLVVTHSATLCLFALFAVLGAGTGSLELAPLKEGDLSPGMATAVFMLALVAFGSKAGVMPLHVWLPSAHAVAPSHVSAIMSGVNIKVALYGLVRVISLLPSPPVAWGGIVLSLGVVSGVLGVAFAIGQHDLKRLLAYHSIENIGIIVMGLGLAMVGRSLGRTDLVVLGLCGSLLHVWNHALFKALLFLSAGSVIHAVHTREIDRLGGLAKVMPWTSLCFVVGSVAICGLPPLNGFVSEFLIYVGVFRTLGNSPMPTFTAAAFAAPALALIGALAVACFVKAYGAIFLGTSRSEHIPGAQESPLSMLGPMSVLVALCFLIGLAPILAVPILERAVWDWAPDLKGTGASLTALAPLAWITTMGLILIVSLMLVSGVLGILLRRSAVERKATWGCGYVAPSARIQYTSSSFAQMLVGTFGWVLRPRTHKSADLALFPQKADFHSEVADPVLDEVVLPAFGFGARVLSRFRVFQQGNIQTYLLYIFLALIALLFWR
jgi:hydrogenase-4 component B